MPGVLQEAKRPLPATVREAAIEMRRLHGVLAQRAQPITIAELPGLHSLASTGEARRSRPTGELTVTMPPITIFDGNVMLGAIYSADRLSIHVPHYISSRDLSPEVDFGRNLRTFGRYPERFETGGYDNIVHTDPTPASSQLPIRISRAPIFPLQADRRISRIVAELMAYDTP